MAEDNLLTDGGELAAWTLLTGDARQAFRERLSVDDATWARGRGWALWKTLRVLRHALAAADGGSGGR